MGASEPLDLPTYKMTVLDLPNDSDTVNGLCSVQDIHRLGGDLVISTHDGVAAQGEGKSDHNQSHSSSAWPGSAPDNDIRDIYVFDSAAAMPQVGGPMYTLHLQDIYYKVIGKRGTQL